MLSQREHKRRVQEFAGTPRLVSVGYTKRGGVRVVCMAEGWRFFKEIRRWKL